MDYSQYIRATSNVPQTERLPGTEKNNAGGYAFKVDKWTQLDRFLVLGSEGGTYYVSERDLTRANFSSVDQCLAEDGKRVIDRVVELSESGRAPKNDPALFVLARATASPHRQYALHALPRVARTGTHLFTFVKYARAYRGWGRGFKRGIANWYNSKDTQKLAYQLVKYKQRDGWSHRDLLRLAHPKANESDRNLLFQKVTHPEIALPKSDNKAIEIYRLADNLSVEKSAEKAAKIIKEHRLPRECVNTELLGSTEVWEALLNDMPMTAMVRNLGKMSSLGMTERYSANAKKIVEKLTNGEVLRKARVHPVSLLGALRVYEQGHGIKGSLRWNANREIIEALNDAFYEAFNFIEPTNKRYFLALDVSGSMFGNSVNGIAGLDAAQASAAMAMVTLRTEKNAIIKGFTSNMDSYGWYGRNPRTDVKTVDGLSDLNISKRMMLDQVMQNIRGLPFGGTDCSLPMRWATKHKVPVDVFVVYTDSETYAGPEHASVSLEVYRQATGIDAKLVVAGVSSNDFTIANPTDPGMLDVVGFDSAAPQIINDFASGKI